MEYLGGDEQALAEQTVAQAVYDWRRRRYPTRCEFEALAGIDVSKMAWATAIGSLDVLEAAVVLAATLDKFSCVSTRVAFVAKNVLATSLKVTEILLRAGYTIHSVGPGGHWPDISCTSLGLPAEHQPKKSGTYYRYHAWRLEEYERVVYADVDFMLLSNMDELFLRNPGCMIAAPRFERPAGMEGVGDTGMDAGLISLCPSADTAESLLADLREVSSRKGCVNDQVHLFHYFSQPGRSIYLLPFSWNVRKVPFYPMRAFHFAGDPRFKVWKEPMLEHEAADVPILRVPEDARRVFWWFFYEGVRSSHLEEHVAADGGFYLVG
jgi:hypothetical protein